MNYICTIMFWNIMACYLPTLLLTHLILWQGLGDLSNSHKFAVGTRVQAVWSEDGEWWVSLYLLLFAWNDSLLCYLHHSITTCWLAELPGTMQQSKLWHQMDIMWPMMAGETGKRYGPFSENNNLFSILNRGVFIHEYREESYSFKLLLH